MRAFIAIEVPKEITPKVEILEKEFQLEGLTLVKKEAMHITLQFLGEINAEQAERVVEAMKKVHTKPFRINLSGISYFTPRLIRVIFVKTLEGEKELQRLYAGLASELTSRGVAFEAENKYTPHLTIARVKRVKEMRKLREAIEKNSNAEIGSFDARSLFLKESVLTPSGHVYRDLYELKL